jgi:GNAT superfamily N-acetyltransferase
MRLELVGPADTDGSAGADAGGAVGSSSGGPGRGGGGGGSGRERGGPVLLDGAGVAELRMAMEQAFGISADLAELAMPGTVASDDPGHDDDFEAWGLYENGSLVSGTALVRAGESVCVWSMATPPELQGRGFGRRLLAGALESAAAKGASQCLLIASPAGERLYRALGFDLVEHWQLWTRPRWVLA